LLMHTFVLTLPFGCLTLILKRGVRDEPPLIQGWLPFVGKALEFRRDAHGFLKQQKKKFGDVFTVRIAGRFMTFIMDPLSYPTIIKQGRQLDFHAFSDKMASVVFGYTPIRDMCLPGFRDDIFRSFKLLHGDNLAPLTESMMANLMLVFRQDHLSERLREGATFLTLYGRTQDAGRHSGMDSLREDLVKFDKRFPLLTANVPIGLLREAKTSREKLISYFLPHRMSCWSNMSQFIRRRQELLNHDSVMTDMDKAAHHFAMLWASVANTIPTCFWALYHLLSQPEALQAVQQEVHDILNLSKVEFSSDRDVVLSREQLDKLLYLGTAINESLRLSSASMNIRVAQEDFSLRLDGERSVGVRKDDIVILYPQSLHMDPEIYDQPQTFRFDRFVQDGMEKTDFYKDGQKLKYYLMPFGSGASMCPGRHFAINEIKQFLCLLLLYFKLELEEGQARATLDPSRAGLGILSPSTDVRFRYRLRAI
uniref:Uncharacterized protein n=1 Tax=Mola mola TaxID=94237 RepID=A0A3Q3XJH8_MOLML